jgi:hypothetical protein
VEAVAVIVLLPAVTAVTRQELPVSVAVATAGVPDVQVVIVGGVVVLPPVSWTTNVADSPTLRLALGGVIDNTTAGGGDTVTSSPQAPSTLSALRATASNAFFREKSCIHPPLTRSWR